MSLVLVPSQLHQIEADDGEGYHHCLSHLQPIDAGEDVDGIRAEHCQHAHVHIVQET